MARKVRTPGFTSIVNCALNLDLDLPCTLFLNPTPVTYSLCLGPLCPVKGHFVPKNLLGNIIDELTFALNL